MDLICLGVLALLTGGRRGGAQLLRGRTFEVDSGYALGITSVSVRTSSR